MQRSVFPQAAVDIEGVKARLPDPIVGPGPPPCMRDSPSEESSKIQDKHGNQDYHHRRGQHPAGCQ